MSDALEALEWLCSYALMTDEETNEMYSTEPPGTFSRDWDRNVNAIRSALEQKAEPVSEASCCGQFDVEYSSDGLASHEICCGKPDRGGQITNHGSAYSQAEAWLAVVAALDALQPGWILQVGKTAAESAVELIRQWEADAAQYHVVMAEYTTDVYKASKAWPEDIRRKLSIHDLRRMNGWRGPNPPSTAEAEAWISVDERLPEEGGIVAAVLSSPIGSQVHVVAYNPNTIRRWSNAYGMPSGIPNGVDVTHWMPLPEPPEADNGQDD